eukprot:92504_1
MSIDTVSHIPEAHDAKIGSDGSGEIAIKMVHTESTCTMISDIIRLTFSILLLIFSIISVFHAIWTSTTTLPEETFPVWSQYVCLVIALFVLGVLEGLQISVVELAHKDPNNYRKHHPRAADLLEFENKGRNVERFLMGRQVLVVFTVFIAARITTFNGFWAEVPDTLIHSLMFSGFLGVILVVVLAQLTPQVLAAAYPVEFLNLFGMNIGFWACLIVEATGLVHAVWFLCVTVRKLVYNCICAKSEGHDNKFEKMSSHSRISPDYHYDDVDVHVDMLKTAEKAEIDIEEQAELAEMNRRTEYIYNEEKAEIDIEEQAELAEMNRRTEYIYNEEKAEIDI